MLQSRDGDLATPSAIFFLLSSAIVSSVNCCRCRAPPPCEQINSKNQTKLPLDSGPVATQVPLISRTGTLPHDLHFYFCIRRQQYQYGCPSLSPPPLPLSLLLAPSAAAWHYQLLSASSLCHLVMKHSAASTTPRYHFPPFLAAVGHSTVSMPNLSLIHI